MRPRKLREIAVMLYRAHVFAWKNAKYRLPERRQSRSRDRFIGGAGPHKHVHYHLTCGCPQSMRARQSSKARPLGDLAQIRWTRWGYWADMMLQCKTTRTAGGNVWSVGSRHRNACVHRIQMGRVRNVAVCWIAGVMDPPTQHPIWMKMDGNQFRLAPC